MVDQWSCSAGGRQTHEIETSRDLPGCEGEVQHLLSILPELRDLAGPAWARAVASATVVRAHSGARLPVPSGIAAHFSVMLRGALVLRGCSNDGRTFKMYKVQAGEICTLSLMALKGRLNANAVAEVLVEDELLLLRIPAHHLDSLITACSEFRELMFASVMRCVAHTLDLIEEVGFNCLQTRVARYLRERHVASGAYVLKVAHHELANDLGSTREGISRVLKQIERGGLIRCGRGAITVLPALLDASRSALKA